MAQLGARLNGIQKVSGSIPLGSTKNRRPGFIGIRAFFCASPDQRVSGFPYQLCIESRRIFSRSASLGIFGDTASRRCCLRAPSIRAGMSDSS